MAAAARSFIIPLGIFQGRPGIEEAIELIRLGEDLQVDRSGMVAGGHDVDIADLLVQISSAVVFLELLKRP
ncbi:putative ATP synthase mitochondrial F1 complex assembly factor 2 [Cocos nucifera]|uniref:Putative ATP synthase mitochondrial F1 complex assembly factor 2 n=1 Tax=Cocos nucifera TaxID=13894 RepID=A0A8K0HW24_COCNU|nr:putative ATP synthase mitochondrial F1 complex assembly factor 2 [Cocos nucifera]